MAYGVLPEGFLTKPLTQIQADIVARLVASPAVGPSQDYSSSAPLGQIVGGVASEISEVWELGYVVHTSGDPNGALDIPLDQLLSLTGSERQGPRPSTAIWTLSLDAGAIVPAGSLVNVEDRPDIVFFLTEEVSNTTDDPADFPGVFECTEDGPVNVASGTPLEIGTAVTGWTAVTADEDADPGRFAANNIEFRQRWADERGRNGASTVSAIRAMLLDKETTPEFELIEKVLVLTNRGDIPDANGLPPHSIEAIIDDGDTPSVDDDLIAQRMWDAGVSGGINTHGNQSGTATDSNGYEHTVYFSRVTRREIWIEITVEISDSYPNDGDTKVAQALAVSGNDYDVDEDVIAEFIKSRAFTVAGVSDILDFAIGEDPGPTLDDNIPMGYRERAVFSTERITVTAVDL